MLQKYPKWDQPISQKNYARAHLSGHFHAFDYPNFSIDELSASIGRLFKTFFTSSISLLVCTNKHYKTLQQ